MRPTPLDRLSFDSVDLIRDHPPQWRDKNKRAVFEVAYETCRGRARRRQAVTVKDLVNQVEAQWVIFRDGTIAT